MNQQTAIKENKNKLDQQLEECLEQLTNTLQNLNIQRDQRRGQSDRVEASIRRIHREQQRRIH